MTWGQAIMIAIWVAWAIGGLFWFVKFERPRRIKNSQLRDAVLAWPFGEVAHRSRFVLAVMADELHAQMDKYYPVPMLKTDLRDFDWEDDAPRWDPDSWNAHSLNACLSRLEEHGFVRYGADSQGNPNWTIVKITGEGMKEVEKLMKEEEYPVPSISIGDLTNSQVVIMSENVRQTLRDAQATQSDLDPGIPPLIERLLADLQSGALEIPRGRVEELTSEVQHVAEVAGADGMSLRLKRGLRSLSALVMGARAECSEG